MLSEESQRLRPSPAVTGAGIDHVRLFYHYLDSGDMDGCASLLDEDVRMCWPRAPIGRGRAEVARLQAALAGPPTRHEPRKVLAFGDTIVVVGRFVSAARGRSDGVAAVRFADFFTLTCEGMLLDHHRYHLAAP
jgi:hypothetical protein